MVLIQAAPTDRKVPLNCGDARIPRRAVAPFDLRQGEGIAVDPQLPLDTPSRPDFRSAVLRPGETHRSTIRWTFDRT
jgi:galactose mutarotase-like enzyme